MNSPVITPEMKPRSPFRCLHEHLKGSGTEFGHVLSNGHMLHIRHAGSRRERPSALFLLDGGNWVLQRLIGDIGVLQRYVHA